MKPSERIAQIAQARYDRTLALWRQSKYRTPSNDTPDASILAIDIALYLDEVSARHEDNPDWDATDGAHPAWWRGHDHAAVAVAHLLGDVAKNGEHPGTISNPEVRAAAAAILEVWSLLETNEQLAQRRFEELQEERRQLALISQDRDRLQQLVTELSESLAARVSQLELRKDSP